MFSKISVAGKDMHPLYAFLTSKKTNPRFSGDIRWNFDKFLFARDGKILARFHPKTKPESEEIIRAVEEALTK
jgi:glutathione peroxidase